MPDPTPATLAPRSPADALGLLVAVCALVLTAVLVVGAGVLLVKTSKDSARAPAACWKIQSANGHVFKLNECSGETIEIVPERHAAEAASAPAT